MSQKSSSRTRIFFFFFKRRDMHAVLLFFVLVNTSPFQMYSDCNTAWFEGGRSEEWLISDFFSGWRKGENLNVCFEEMLSFSRKGLFPKVSEFQYNLSLRQVVLFRKHYLFWWRRYCLPEAKSKEDITLIWFNLPKYVNLYIEWVNLNCS